MNSNAHNRLEKRIKSPLCKQILEFILLLGMVVGLPAQSAQAADLIVTNFDTGTDGFLYEDDTFSTTQPSYASGSRITGSNCYGATGGCLNVRLGGVDSTTVTNMSGGWKYTFSLPSALTGLSLSLRYRLVMPSAYIYDEFSRVQVSLDGVLFGRGSRAYVDHTGGDGNFAHDSGWLQTSLFLGDLAAGTHTLILGGFSNKKTSSTKITDIYLDDVALTSENPAPATSDTQLLVDRLNLANFKTNIQSVAAFGDRCRNSTSCAPYTSFNNAQNWVEQQLQAMGYTTFKHNYTYSGWTGSNLYATKTGSVYPNQMYIISGHLDGRGGGGAADDDGSAVSLILEIARVLASPDVQTDYSVRFLFFDQEEIGLYGSNAYVSNRRSLQGTAAEPTWLGIIQHDMILYDHGVGTVSPSQSVYADLDVEWRDGTTYAAQSKTLAQAWRFYNGTFASQYPANSANYSTNTDDTPFQPYTAAISVRENRRNLSGEWINPYYHKSTDIYNNYSEADFALGFNAVQTTLSTVAELAGASILSGNTAPTADPQSLSTPEDTPLSITLTASDPEGDPLSFSIVSAPAHGALSGSAPALLYTPAPDFNGSDSFTFKASDGSLDSSPATVSISVSPVNDPPSAFAQSLSTPEDTPLSITLTGSDPDGDGLSFSIVSAPVHGALSGSAPALLYTPAPDFNGSDSFTFKVSDGSLDSSPATVSLSVTPVNDPPTAFSQEVAISLNTAVSITLAGSDPENDPLSFAVTADPIHGTLSGTSPDLLYTPNAGYTGPDSFDFTAYDGSSASTSATVSITVESMVYTLPYSDNFESDKGWIRNPAGTDTSSSGFWEIANPQGTNSDGPKQLDQTTSGVTDLVTGPLAGNNVNSYDLDGLTSMLSPLIQLPSGQDISLSFQYYFAHGKNASSADFLRVKVVGNSTLTVMEILGINKDIDAVWKSKNLSLNSFAGQKIRVLVEAGDLSKNSLVEAALDDLFITASQPSGSLITANFDSTTEGFTYLDDVFRGTDQPAYAAGTYGASAGVSGGGLQVSLGGLDTEIIQGISGGWQIPFSLPAPAIVQLSFWFNLTQSADYDADECSQALVSVDNVLYGSGEHDYIAQVCGNGNGGIEETTGWQLFSVTLGPLPAGEHVVVIGGYNDQKSYTNEYTNMRFDQVLAVAN